MRSRGIAGLFMVILGAILIASSIGSLVAHFSTLSSPLFGITGGILLVVGLLLLVTDRIESWLSKGQAALVDGLQAG